MINLFSRFDPSSKILTNWVMLPLIIIILPFYSIKSTKYKKIKIKIKEVIKTEIKFNKLSLITNIIPVLFIILITLNLTSLIPHIFSITAHISITLSLALPLWITPVIMTITKNINHVLEHLTPLGTPYPIIRFIVIIESIRILIRPLTLSVRLAANITSGHLIITLLSTRVQEIIIKPTLIIQLALLTLELIVSIIQAYVFCILLNLYTAENIN